MKLIPKKWRSVPLIVKESLNNKFLVSTAQDTLVQEGLENASEMFESSSPSLYN